MRLGGPVEGIGLGVQAQVKLSSLPFTSCVSLGKSPSSSGPQFLVSSFVKIRVREVSLHRSLWVLVLPFPPPPLRVATAGQGADHPVPSVLDTRRAGRSLGPQPSLDSALSACLLAISILTQEYSCILNMNPAELFIKHTHLRPQLSRSIPGAGPGG